MSKNCRESDIFNQLWALVTPGLSPVLATFFFAIELINVDLPTLGIPTTKARSDLFTRPFLAYASNFGAKIFFMKGWICFIL